jgi:hypothetical protein
MSLAQLMPWMPAYLLVGLIIGLLLPPLRTWPIIRDWGCK